MKPEWRRFAPVGLYIALAATLAAVGFYIVQREFNLAVQISLGLIIIGLAIFAILDPNRIREALTGRQARHGSNALVLSIAFVGILVVINYMVLNNSKRWDLTEDKENTLAVETIDTLNSLPEPVTATAFFTPRVDSSTAESLLNQYEFESDGTFSYEFVDPEMDPVAAEAANVTRDGTVILSMGDNQEVVTFVSEQELTAAMVRLINPQESAVYFLTGHGEYSPEDTGEQSYSEVKRTLESKNYIVKTINLLAANQLPEDTKVVVIAGPRKPLTPIEVDLLGEFMANGGAVVVMQEPLPVTEFGDTPDPMADYLAATWGVTLGVDIVVDTTSTQPFAPYAAQYVNHPITQKIQSFTSQYPSARSVTVAEADSGVSQVELVFTSDQSWAETDLAGLAGGSQNPSMDEGDLVGPVPLAVAAENFLSGGRLVAFGDSDYAIDVNFYAYANGDVFINSVDWAAGQEDLINLTPKETTQRTVIPPQTTVINLILLIAVIVLPGLALVAGVVVFIQRRRRG